MWASKIQYAYLLPYDSDRGMAWVAVCRALATRPTSLCSQCTKCRDPLLITLKSMKPYEQEWAAGWFWAQDFQSVKRLAGIQEPQNNQSDKLSVMIWCPLKQNDHDQGRYWFVTNILGFVAASTCFGIIRPDDPQLGHAHSYISGFVWLARIGKSHSSPFTPFVAPRQASRAVYRIFTSAVNIVNQSAPDIRLFPCGNKMLGPCR